MQTEKLFMMDPGYYEYLLVIHPDAEVSEKVMAEKQNFYDDYREKVVATRPHITVASFHAKEAMEDTFIRWMQIIFSKQKSFPVVLNNYSGFPPHTIYLRVQNAEPIQQLANELKVVNTYVSSCSCPPMKLISRPHISIAGRLTEEVYFKALTQYAHKSFHETFLVNELLLVKRKHPHDICKPINVFRLLPGANEIFN